MERQGSLKETNSYNYDSIGEYESNICGSNHEMSCAESVSSSDRNFSRYDDSFDSNCIENENSLLLPTGENIESDEGDLESKEAQRQRDLDYRHENRYLILTLVALTPAGVKFFKAAQSSFQEYFMNDPKIMMSATTYSFSLSLMSFPVATLLGGLMLDYKAKHNRSNSKQATHGGNCITSWLRNPISSNQSCLGTSWTPSYSAIFFLGISFLGIMVYGYGLEKLHSIPIGLAGSAIFGMGEGCVVVASRTFAAHAFYGSDGAFAQGVLVAINSLTMMVSKISLPWLIENEKKMQSEFFLGEASSLNDAEDDKSILIGIIACCTIQLLSLSAGMIYALKFGLAPLPQSQIHSEQESSQFSHKKSYSKNKAFSPDSSLRSRVTACFEKLPITFWIVAIGRAIFVVVFKVFTRNSNSFLMEKFGVGAVTAGIKSSTHELFALGSPVVGYLAYRSPGGIVPVLLFAAALGSASIATLACVSASVIQHYLPGGAITPIIGISIAHGIFIPICMAIIPQTCSPEHTGMAFAVVEVLGSIFNLTNILFGWLRDYTGAYEVPMEMLLFYSLVGLTLLSISRNHIKFAGPIEQ